MIELVQTIAGGEGREGLSGLDEFDLFFETTVVYVSSFPFGGLGKRIGEGEDDVSRGLGRVGGCVNGG